MDVLLRVLLPFELRFWHFLSGQHCVSWSWFSTTVLFCLAAWLMWFFFLFSMTYFAEVFQMNILFCRKHFKHAPNYFVWDTTDKKCLIFQPWHDGASLGRLALYKAAHISICLQNWRYTAYKRNFLLSVLEFESLLQYLY